MPAPRLLLTLGVGSLMFAGMEAQTRPGAAALGTAQWREDVRHFARELPKRHKNLYHATTREQFERDVAALESAIPSLEHHQIIVRLQQIAASIGDGHTRVQLPAYFMRYPINVYWFPPPDAPAASWGARGGELRVIAAAKQYESALGARVVRIGNVDIEDVASRVATCLPSAANENDWYVLNMGPAIMMRPEVLHALGIVPELSRAAFTFEDAAGKPITLDVAPVALPPVINGAVNLGLVPIDSRLPLYRQKLNEPFWFTHLQDSNTVYANFRRYVSLKQHAQALFAFIDRTRPSRVVIDLRQNGGGDFFEGREHVIEPIKKRPMVNQKGRLYVIVGRATFSAAMVNAIDFRKQTNAILVGEPIGERPNSYSENDEMTLPNSRLVVSYSTRYYQFVDQDVPAVLPDERIDQSWTDFRAGRDAVMDWILSRPLP